MTFSCLSAATSPSIAPRIAAHLCQTTKLEKSLHTASTLHTVHDANRSRRHQAMLASHDHVQD